VFDELVSLIDLPPTLLAAAGLEVPDYMRGRSLQELIEGTAGSWRDEVFIQISESHTGRALRTRRWKYSVRAPGEQEWGETDASEHYVEDFLYDLESDPHERGNLVQAPEHAELRASLAETLKSYIAQVEGMDVTIAPAT
jgi:arylsulfatase A-like enzyme